MFRLSSLRPGLLLALCLSIALPLSLVLTKRIGHRLVRADSVATFSFSPSSAYLDPGQTVDLMLDPQGQPVGFVHVDLLFDPFKIGLSGDVVTSPHLATVIQKTPLEEANVTGKMTLVLGLEPTATASTEPFVLATLPLTAVTASATEGATLNLDPATVQVVTTDTTVLPPQLNYLSIFLNQSTPSPSPSPSSTPTPTPIPSPTPTPTPTPIPNTTATLTLTPSRSSFNLGEPIELTLKLNSSSPVTGVDVFLNYNPRLISITSLTDHHLLPNTPVLDFNNGSGIIRLSQVANPSAPYQGEGNLITITATTVQVGAKDFVFTYTPGSKTDTNVISATTGQDILATPTNLTFNVLDPLKLHLKFTTPSEHSLAYTGTLNFPAANWQTSLTTNDQGEALLSPPETLRQIPGTLTLRIPSFLSKSLPYTAAGGEQILDFGALIPGDLNQDDIVNTLDLAILYTDWFSATISDYNRDGIVNSADHWHLIQNYFATP